MYSLNFINQVDFEKHVTETLMTYYLALRPYDLNRFNSNLVDPIKLLFDKSVKGVSYEDIIHEEIQRQRDKTDTNQIGAFHQNMFKYIKDCEVPQKYWDVIYKGREATYFVEMKNKHNTMNSASGQRTFIKLQHKIAEDEKAVACLVEAIAKKSQDIEWTTKVDGIVMRHPRIRRMSLDKFYALVTGEEDAFYQMCMQLPETINEIVAGHHISPENDTVIQELKQMNPDILKALYELAFGTYLGFDKLKK